VGSLLVVLRASPEEEGCVRFAWEMAKAAAASGHEVTLFALAEGAYAFVEGADLGVAAELPAAGVGVSACEQNAKERGLAEGRLHGAVRMSSTTQLAALAKRADRVLFVTP
jgi:predicted peroxiredoxin